MLQQSVGLSILQTSDDWIDAPRTEVDIRYDKVVRDALRAASKSRFDPTKLIQVNDHFLSIIMSALCIEQK